MWGGRRTGNRALVSTLEETLQRLERERDEAVRIELKQILAERDKGVPVVFLGDMNERETVFCKVTGQSDLSSVTPRVRRPAPRSGPGSWG